MRCIINASINIKTDMKKFHEHLETLGLCPCLISLIQFEISLGNKITSHNTHGGWPKKKVI